MRIYEIKQSFRRFESFAKAAPYLDTLVSIREDFQIEMDYMNDLPICVKTKFYYLTEEETRCHTCKERKDCPAFDTGVIYPCPYYEEEEEH